MSDLYGDYEPEDAWDAGDTIDDQIINLFHRIALVDRLRSEPERGLGRAALLISIRERMDDARTRTDEHRRRLDLLARDLTFVESRL